MLKFFLLLPLSIFCMSLPSQWLFAGIITASITAFLCGFTLREQANDLKPAFFYGVLMYALSVFSTLVENFTSFLSVLSVPVLISAALMPRPDFIRIALRLVLIVQLSALLFRSTSSIEIREGLTSIERFVRKLLSHLPFFGKWISPQCRIAGAISLFLCFIPEIFENWTAINLAWKARAGKQGLSKIKTTVFVLISLCMEKAAVKAKALEARGETR
jgi:biotin transport system permease protein/energy-coupling factor transport system permease protein